MKANRTFALDEDEVASIPATVSDSENVETRGAAGSASGTGIDLVKIGGIWKLNVVTCVPPLAQ